MTHVFQSSDSIKNALYEELQNILCPQKEIREAAEGRMKQLEVTEGYGVFLTEIIMNQSFELALRQLAAVMLTRYVEQHWDDVDGVATEQAKRMIRNILPNGLYDSNSKIRTSVAYTISSIAASDWPTKWPELFDIIVKCLGSNEDSIHGAMQVLVEFTHDWDNQITEVGPIIISEVYRIFEAEQVFSVKTRTIAVTIFKSLFKSINEYVETVEEQDKLLNPILPSIIEKLMSALKNPDPNISSYKLKTEIIKVLAFMVNEMQRYINQYTAEILPPIWQLLTQTADVYVKVVVNGLEPNQISENDDEDELTNFTTMIMQILEFIHSILESGKFKLPVKNVLTDLMYIMIVYMQITEEQIESWSEDAEQFIEDDYQDNDGIGSGTIRMSSQDVLRNISEEFGAAKVLTALSAALENHISVAEAEKAAGSQYWWKIHEASMLAVGYFKELILEKAPSKFDLAQYLNYVRSTMVCCQDVSPYLLARCIWVLSRFASSQIYSPESLVEVLDAIHSSLQPDKTLNLRIYAIRSVYELCEYLKDCKDERRTVVLSKLTAYLDGLISIIPLVQSSVLAILMETATSMISFDEQFAASASGKIIPLTIAVFLKHHDDPFLLECVQDMLKILCQNRFCLIPLQEKIVPTLVSILNLQAEHTNNIMQGIALDVLATIVKYSESPLSDQLIENAFPAAVQCILRTDDHAIMQSGGECLRAFIFISPHQVCSYKNGQGLNYIMEITTMLLNPMNTEYTAAFIGRLVITIISRAGTIIGDNIYLLLKAVISKMQLVESLNVAMSLIMTFAHLFVTQMEAVLNFLSTVPGPTGEPAIQYVFSQWLSRQHLFYGSYERKISTMALCKLFEHGVTTKDVRLVTVTIRDAVETRSISSRPYTRSHTRAQEWHNIPILVKIFKLLINELAHFRELKSSEFVSDDDYTDDENDDGNNTAGGSGGGGGGGGGNNNKTGNGDDHENSPSKKHTVKLSDLLDEEEDDENDQLMQDLMLDPIFQTNMEENLTKFLQNFSRDDHFHEFVSHLNDAEKSMLRDIQVTVQ